MHSNLRPFQGHRIGEIPLPDQRFPPSGARPSQNRLGTGDLPVAIGGEGAYLRRMYQATSRAPKPRREWLWRLLAIVGATIVGAAIIGTVLEQLDSGASRSHRPPIRRAIPVGRAANIGNGWTLKMLRVTPRAERKARAEAKATPPPRGSRYFLIRLALTYAGSGKGPIRGVVEYGLQVVSADGVSYSIFHNPCDIFTPDPDLEFAEAVHPGQTARGYLCMQIGHAARPRLLHTGNFPDFFSDPTGLDDRWFALR
jgi:hypothetical protein